MAAILPWMNEQKGIPLLWHVLLNAGVDPKIDDLKGLVPITYWLDRFIIDYRKEASPLRHVICRHIVVLKARTRNFWGVKLPKYQNGVLRNLWTEWSHGCIGYFHNTLYFHICAFAVESIDSKAWNQIERFAGVLMRKCQIALKVNHNAWCWAVISPFLLQASAIANQH